MEVNKEVYYAVDSMIKLASDDIQLLLEKAMHNDPKKIRLCTHKDVDDKLHEMFIMSGKDTYIKPHKHPNKSISYYIIEGSVDVIFFDEIGNIVDVIQMGSYSSKCIFYFRISYPYYYMPITRSEFLIFHEITNGPFNNDTVFAPWAPEGSNKTAVNEFMEKIESNIKNFLEKNV